MINYFFVNNVVKEAYADLFELEYLNNEDLIGKKLLQMLFLMLPKQLLSLMLAVRF